MKEFEKVSTLVLWVNGKEVREENPSPTESLISFLRRRLGLTGTKLGCAEGGCGSCTVYVSSFDYQTRRVTRGGALNACLSPIVSLHRKHVVTIEGLGSAKNPHPIQKVLAESHASQCGFCTPGIAMSLYATLDGSSPTAEDIEDSFDGNLCRCTGYRSILSGAKKFAHCADSSNDNCAFKENIDVEDLGKQVVEREVTFPKALLDWHLARAETESYSFVTDTVKWIHPSCFSELLAVMKNYPMAKIVNGNTEVGIETRFKNLKYSVLVAVSDVPELQKIIISEEGFELGAGLTWTKLQQEMSLLLEQIPEKHQKRGIQSILDNIKYFAGRQVRNVSSIAGNICTASPISDMNPVWMALGAYLKVQSATSVRLIRMSDFYLGYRKTALQPSEILVSLFVPFTRKNEYTRAFKQAKRRDDDIAIVNSCFRVLLDEEHVVRDACLVYGGMAATTVIAKSASKYLIGKKWSLSLPEEVAPLLLENMPLVATSPGGQIEFRKTLSMSFFQKFVIYVCDDLYKTDHSFPKPDSRSLSCMDEIHRSMSQGLQVFTESEGPSIVGKSMKHVSALKQISGEAIYVEDMPRLHNELYAAIVGSAFAKATLLSVDASAALEVPGVVDYITYTDIPNLSPNANTIGPVFHDEELFATKEVHHVGQMIGIIVAESEEIAKEAAKLVKIKYEKSDPIVTIEDAIASQSFFKHERTIKTGEFQRARESPVPLSSAEHYVTGRARMSGQEHFYLEANASVVIPGREDDEIEVNASTQNPTETQHLVAHVLGIDANKVVCRVKRLGGGFGGKETRSVFLSCALAVAARKLGRPVRCMLSREEDMAISGMRHPFLGNYKVGFTSEGQLVSLELQIYSNGGYSMDLSLAVLERSLTHSDSCYYIPNVHLHGRICKTNLPTNTAFRGFGGPQGLMIAEQWITHVADYLGKPQEVIRALNFYKEGQFTHFNMPLEQVYFSRVWNELQVSSDFQKRKLECEEFNKRHKYRKRGIVIMPTKFGLAFTARFLNQAAAVVHVYSDGSVRLTHGGTEMGQGLHTKMIQITAHELDIPTTMIHLSETRTDIVINTSATAASVSSDLNGMAIVDACSQINNRLKPLRQQFPTLTWKELVNRAYFERINLSANGFYKTPDLTYDWNTNTGRMFSYFTYGAACTEVEIDTLTGDHIVIRSDVLMDIGRPINPAIDIGQIEGAFVQGQGWCTIEEPLFSPSTGFLLTRGPGLYKIPGFKDIPVDFRISILDGVRNTRAVHSSKAVGEPPLFLGASVFFAIKNAIMAARLESGLSGFFELPSPATSERIRLSCQDNFVAFSKTDLKDGEKSWSVAA